MTKQVINRSRLSKTPGAVTETASFREISLLLLCMSADSRIALLFRQHSTPLPRASAADADPLTADNIVTKYKVTSNPYVPNRMRGAVGQMGALGV